MVTLNHLKIVDSLIRAIAIFFIIVISIPAHLFNHLIDLRHRTKTICFFILMTLAAYNTVQAQSLNSFLYRYQVGLEGQFGSKSFSISSNIPEINKLKVSSFGGSFGIIFGAKKVVAKIKQGFYYSGDNVPYSIDEVRTSGMLNLYPFYSMNPESPLRPYFLVGIEYDAFQMRGYYDGKDHSQVNMSRSDDPFLGKISLTQATLGAGIEYRIKSPGNFVSFFSEIRYGKPVFISTTATLFQSTTFSNQMALTVGISCGYHH